MSDFFFWLPYELHVKIFGNLTLYELFNCQNVCHYFEHVIKTNPWHNHIVRLTNTVHIRWFASNYNFQKFKIDDENLKLTCDIWEVLSKKQKVLAKVTHITKCFDDYPSKFIKSDKRGFYFIFRDCIQISLPNDATLVEHLVSICEKSNGTLHQILKCAIEELHPDTKEAIYINKTVKLPFHTKMLLDENRITTNYNGCINDMESLNYYLKKFVTNISSCESLAHILISLLKIVGKIDHPYILEEVQNIISNNSWIIECMGYLHKDIIDDTFLTQLGRGKISAWYETNPKFDQLFYTVTTLWRGFKCGSHHKFQFILQVLLPYIKSITQWKNVQNFCLHHPNYLTELANYDAGTNFCLGNEFIRKVIQKEKYQSIWRCIKGNVLLCAQLAEVECKFAIHKGSEIYLPDCNLRDSYIKKTFQTQCQIGDTFSWLLQNYHLQDFRKFYHQNTPPINLITLLQKNNISLIQFIMDNDIRYTLNPTTLEIKMLVEHGQAIVLDFLFEHKLLPGKKVYNIGLDMNKIVWLVKHVNFFSVTNELHFNYVTCNQQFNGCHIALNNLQFDSNQIVLLLKWIHVRNFEIPAHCLTNIFYQGVRYHNLCLLQVLHKYFFKPNPAIRAVLNGQNILNELHTRECEIIHEWLHKKGYIVMPRCCFISGSHRKDRYTGVFHSGFIRLSQLPGLDYGLRYST